MLCGALITEQGSDVYSIHYVTSSKAERAKPLLWPGPEVVEVAANGTVARRKPAIAGPRNHAAAVFSDAIGQS